MDLQIQGKTALVTGSTAGIGLAIGRRLAAEGAHVVLTGRDPDKLQQAVEDLRTSTGSEISGVVADMATAEGAETVLAHVPEVDILVNNLGIYESKAFEEITDADWLRYFEVNVMSGVRLARGYFPAMLASGSGRIIFISSETGLAVDPGMIHYAMTKTAQLSIARGMAVLTRGTGVTVNSVLPGPTRSEGIVDYLRSIASKPDASAEEAEAEFFAGARSGSLLQRMIEADEIASLVAYLVSPLAAATNGAAVRVEGGLINSLA
ncbi:SDR family oxidoreductase [Brevundimonas sp.]|uniref:SDR family NAD(P)-dependent oxidoreductase n=1 Tax=Brevundimonas sp. TaxID=1871086 RepID=UPI002D583556|nr:SDR family oxidoreductase [Brevundimonas sp.]HYC98131.1 SDR family oxidoreductase [Brevundimonas sp.]